MKKRILMIAFHFPPMLGSSGVQRTLKFVKYLPTFGWQPIVLTTHPRAYRVTNDEQISEIPSQAIIHRAFALDTSQHLSIMKHYPRTLSLPDRWVSWLIGAIPTGLYLIKKYKPDVIWSTYPIATAHLIGLTLSRLTGIPWIADFRDPMVDQDDPMDPFPSDPLALRSYQWIEREAIAHSTKSICTSPSLIEHYKSKFPKIPHSRFSLIENGYDEELYKNLEENVTSPEIPSKKFVLLHSGIIYSSERNPIQFFKSLSTLLQNKVIEADNFKVILRATSNDAYIEELITKFGINSIVTTAPLVPYKEALSEMLNADGLLIIQASNCNKQIPAKLYEYIRARRPIFALTDMKGDTANKLLSLGINTIAQLDSEDDISRKLIDFVTSVRNNTARLVPMEQVITNSRKSKTREFVDLLETLTSPSIEQR